MRNPEAKIKDAIRAHLKGLGVYVFSPVQMGLGSTTLDLLCCWPNGAFVAIEVKAEGKKPTARQKQVMEQIKTANGIAFWCDSFEEYLRQLEVHGLR